MTKDKNIPIYTISTAANLLNISVHTIRMYEREGLLIPFKKPSGQRLYSDADIERIECIRHSIKRGNLNIQGIKKILSLIPCWSITNCSKKERKLCNAYNSFIQPCWMYRYKENYHKTRSCRECRVYLETETCESIKQKLKELLQ
jgi:MerR family transcriptional regulator/heat shock protein HspR